MNEKPIEKTTARVKVRGGPMGIGTRIWLDGREISKEVLAFEIKATAGGMNEITIKVFADLDIDIDTMRQVIHT